MIRSISFIALLSFAAATSGSAQVPGGRMDRPNAPRPAAKLLLGNTGELELTDAQVVRLAAIARRSEARQRSLRASMDSARSRFGGQPGDSLARRQFAQRMQAETQRFVEQDRIDQRDAIAVLTPDQQAKAWQLVANRGAVRGARRSPGEMRGMRPPGAKMRRDGFREQRRQPMREPRRMPMRPPRPL